ncbi:MAG: hypothetical protein NTW21_27775 [Verrucomicrobia bacterium]|nr:hypothetical protein [Verrucomicrobiota bacterium]
MNIRGANDLPPPPSRASPLWQIVTAAGEAFVAGYEKIHRATMGPLRPNVFAAVRNFLRGGDRGCGVPPQAVDGASRAANSIAAGHHSPRLPPAPRPPDRRLDRHRRLSRKSRWMSPCKRRQPDRGRENGGASHGAACCPEQPRTRNDSWR